jgi:hypothetical protein
MTGKPTGNAIKRFTQKAADEPKKEPIKGALIAGAVAIIVAAIGGMVQVIVSKSSHTEASSPGAPRTAQVTTFRSAGANLAVLPNPCEIVDLSALEDLMAQLGRESSLKLTTDTERIKTCRLYEDFYVNSVSISIGNVQSEEDKKIRPASYTKLDDNTWVHKGNDVLRFVATRNGRRLFLFLSNIETEAERKSAEALLRATANNL